MNANVYFHPTTAAGFWCQTWLWPWRRQRLWCWPNLFFHGVKLPLVWTWCFPLREVFNFEGQLLCTSNVIRIGECWHMQKSCAILIPWFQYNSLCKRFCFMSLPLKATLVFCVLNPPDHWCLTTHPFVLLLVLLKTTVRCQLKLSALLLAVAVYQS
jgi:hypothetical protein